MQSVLENVNTLSGSTRNLVQGVLGYRRFVRIEMQLPLSKHSHRSISSLKAMSAIFQLAATSQLVTIFLCDAERWR